MPREESPESNVDAFLADAPAPRPVSTDGCASCNLPNVETLNRALVRFVQARAAGDTTVPLVDFYRLHLKAKLNYPLAETSLRRHMRNCLGLFQRP